MEQVQLIISVEQAKSIAQSIFFEIKVYCTDHPDEFAAFLEHEKYSKKADYIEKKTIKPNSEIPDLVERR
jgi:hypothetical protein